MAKFRKKPIVIDADVYTMGMEDGWERGAMLAVEATRKGIETATVEEWAELHAESLIFPFIKTLENQKYYIAPGDYIITGVDGERYACKHDIFSKTYDKVE